MACTIERELYLPREPVFEAWTESEHLAQWFPPEGCTVERVVAEAVAGGRFSIEWREASGEPVRESGRFAEVSAPERLVCILEDEAAGVAGRRLRVEMIDGEDTCRVRLDEEGRGDDSAALRRGEWEARLDRLEAYFSAI